LYDEVINAAQGVPEFASVGQQQSWISSPQNADCVDDGLPDPV
jgi:hypothetical protein